jgi:hypothetical protein
LTTKHSGPAIACKRPQDVDLGNGDHELAENIVHLVLAKIPGPDGKLVAGVRGISLFIVPKKMAGQ